MYLGHHRSSPPPPPTISSARCCNPQLPSSIFPFLDLPKRDNGICYNRHRFFFFVLSREFPPPAFPEVTESLVLTAAHFALLRRCRSRNLPFYFLTSFPVYELQIYASQQSWWSLHSAVGSLPDDKTPGRKWHPRNIPASAVRLSLEACVPVRPWHVRALTHDSIFTFFMADVTTCISNEIYGYLVSLFFSFFSLRYSFTPEVTGACAVTTDLIILVNATTTTTTTRAAPCKTRP